MKNRLFAIVIIIALAIVPVFGQANSNGKPPAGNPSEPTTLKATYVQSGGSVAKTAIPFAATEADTSAIYVNAKGLLDLVNATLSKRGDTSSEDTSNFYGLNAAMVASGGASISLKDSTITTSANGSNGVFATGDGSKVTVSNVIINTTKNSSRGLDATYNGTIVADKATITTSGEHCAALATDRGEGTVTVTNSKCKTFGAGSPGIYSTGNISASDSSFIASGSEAAVIEGKNSIALKNTDISGTKRCGVMIYQSFSGDASVGTGNFSMTGGTLTAASGPLFYSTNTKAAINLNGVKLVIGSGVSNESDSTLVLFKAGADQWGTAGSNGAQVTFNASNQKLDGSVEIEKGSSISLVLVSSSSLSGAVNKTHTSGTASISLDASSRWNVTADSYVAALADGNAQFANILSNGNNVYYDAANASNKALNGKTYLLAGGGKLTPVK